MPFFLADKDLTLPQYVFDQININCVERKAMLEINNKARVTSLKMGDIFGSLWRGTLLNIEGTSRQKLVDISFIF